MSTEILLTSYKINKNLIIESKEENGKNTLFVNSKKYVFNKIDKNNFFVSEKQKDIINLLTDTARDIKISFYILSKKPFKLECKISCDHKIYDKIILDQYDIESFAGLPTQKSIERLGSEYCNYIDYYNDIHGSFANIFIRAAIMYIYKIDLRLKSIPSIPSNNKKTLDKACSIEEQDMYIQDILTEATNDIEKQLFNTTIKVILLTQINPYQQKFKSLELARNELVKNELKTCQNLENLFTNLVADIQDFTNKALQHDQFKHLIYRDIKDIFCDTINDGTVKYYNTFNKDDLLKQKDLLLVSIDRYLNKIKEVKRIIQDTINKHINSKVTLIDCRNIINKEVNHLDAMFKGIQFLVNIGCKLHNQNHRCLNNECLQRILLKLYTAYKTIDTEEFLYCDAKLAFVECSIEPIKIVEHYTINNMGEAGHRTDIDKKLTLHLLEFLLKEKVVNPDNGEEMSFYNYKTNDIRILLMTYEGSSDVKEHAIQFLKILSKYGYALKQEHLDTLQNTIIKVSNNARQKAIEYADVIEKQLEKKCNKFKQGYYTYLDNLKYLQDVKPFVEFIKNNIK